MVTVFLVRANTVSATTLYGWAVDRVGGDTIANRYLVIHMPHRGPAVLASSVVKPWRRHLPNWYRCSAHVIGIEHVLHINPIQPIPPTFASIVFHMPFRTFRTHSPYKV